jgi:ribosomal protein S18 acetylase RimI-like enzyme
VVDLNVTILKADLRDPNHQREIVRMMDAYSRDPMGDGKPLSEYACNHLIEGLIGHPTTIVFLVYENDVACGIATCFRGFSTFAARPLINLSDFYIEPRLRGRGFGKKLLQTIEKEARATGCCKLTLEVQQNNQIAQSVYGQFGFRQAVYAADADGGGSLYMVKPLDG